jgi:hypothetical protein
MPDLERGSRSTAIRRNKRRAYLTIGGDDVHAFPRRLHKAPRAVSGWMGGTAPVTARGPNPKTTRPTRDGDF